MKKSIINKDNWMIILASAFLVLAALYHCTGISHNVYWIYLNKSIKSFLIVILLIKVYPTLPNTISILMNFGLIAYFSGLSLFRLICVLISKGVYQQYREFMSDYFFGVMFSLFIFFILVAIKYLNRK